MTKIKLFFALCLTLTMFSKAYTTDDTSFQKDADLVNLLTAKKMTLIIVRHGEAISNLDDLTTSSRTPGYYLTQKGIEGIQSTAEELADRGISVIYTSPLYRTLQSAQILGKMLHIPPSKQIVDARLAQQNFGVFEGATYQEYKSYFPSSNLLYAQAAPGGESGKTVFERTRNMLWQIASNNQKNVLIVTHAFNYGYINKCLTDEFGAFPPLSRYCVFDFNNKSVTVAH